MSQESASTDAITAAIEAAFDGRWGAWLSDTGTWWAARRHPLTAGQLAAGCVPFVQAATPGELTARITEQETGCPQ